MTSLRSLLRVPSASEPAGRRSIREIDPRSTPGFDGDKSDGKDELADTGQELAALQERLFAEGRAGGRRRVVLVLQGMDTGGKDGTIRHVLGLVDPGGVRITSFGPPTQEELEHDFLWRAERALPPPGFLGVFNRSHYEDVLIVRVHDLVPPEQWEQRYDQINAWEAELAGRGVTFVKVFLHISYEEQRERLLARIDDPEKHWKVNPADLSERRLWPAYQEAYDAALERCSTSAAPWYVLPADRKWYRNWAVSQLLLETLEDLDPRWPVPEDLDLPALRSALLDEPPLDAGRGEGQGRRAG